MISKLNIPLWAFLLFFTLVKNKNYIDQDDLNVIPHNVVVHHPGEKTPLEVVVLEVRDSNGLPVEYYVDVQSVICLQNVCKVIPVRIYWSNIGVYQRYAIESGSTLEKYKADLFEPEDYKKLDLILENPDSPFKDVHFDEILTVENEVEEDVDAISGATALVLDERDTVPGAALTCFTLWHWANGEIVSIIKNLTGDAVSNQQLMAFIENNDDTYYYLALEQLIKRGVYLEECLDLVLRRVMDSQQLIRPTLSYIETAPEEVYFKAIKRLFKIGNQPQKIAALKSIQNIKYTPTKEYLDSLGTNISILETFPEIAAFLELMEVRAHYSKVLINNILPLLEEDFLIARRVYWFLANAPLNGKQKKKTEKYLAQNKERL